MSGDVVEHSVDVAATLVGAVEFRQIDVLVDGDADGNVREGQHFGDGDLHNDHVHISQTRKIPVARRLAHIALVGVGVENGGAEEFSGKFAVFLVLVFGQQFLSRRILGFESADGFQHERIDHLFVVVPVEAALFEQRVEVVVFLNDLLVDFSPHFAVGFVGIVVAFDVFAIDFALLDEYAHLTNELDVVGPRQFHRLGGIAQHLVVFELKGEFVVYKLRRRFLGAFASCALLSDFDAVALFVGDGHDEQQQQVIEVVGLRQAEEQLLLGIVEIAVAVLVVGVGQLHDFDSDQFSVNHLSLKNCVK